MKVRINFYDELITINLPQPYKDFKNEIGKKYSIDSADVEELIIFYTDSNSQRVTITNEADYHRTDENFQEMSKKKIKLPDIMLEVSEKSMMFIREIENSKLNSGDLPKQSDNKKDQIQKEIEEKERILQELLEKDKEEAQIKKVKEAERQKKAEEKEKERLRKAEAKEQEKKLKEEEKLRKAEEKENEKRLKEQEKLRKAEEKEKKRLGEEEKMKIMEEEAIQKQKLEEEAIQKQKLEEEARQKQILEEEQEIQRRMHEEKQRRSEEEHRVRKERECSLREKLMEMKIKIQKEKAKYHEKCCADNEVKLENDIKVENVDKPLEIKLSEKKTDEEEKGECKKLEKEKHLKKSKVDSADNEVKLEDDIKVENVDKPLEINLPEKKTDEEEKGECKKLKKEKHLKKSKVDSVKEASPDKEKKKELKKKDKKHKKVSEELKDKFKICSNKQQLDPEFSQILSKVINDNMESAKNKIIKKALKEASKIFEKTRQSLIFSSTISQSNVLHSKITCDGCKMFPLIGNRYKCTICNDFDYCELCEENFSEVHKHPFLKIRRPEVAPIRILCAINDNVPDFISPKEEKIDLNSPDLIRKHNQEPKEVIPTEDFFSKVKNAITNNVKEIPKNFKKFEGIIQKGVQNLMSSESEERKRLRPTVAFARQCYYLENVSDDQILDALVETGGDIDNAICLLFTEKEN